MIWWVYRLVCFLVVYSDGSAAEIYNGRVTPVNNNRVAFSSANGNTVQVNYRFKRKTVTRIIWEDK